MKRKSSGFSFDRFFKKTYQIMDRTIAANLSDGFSVLDIGSGNGIIAKMIEKHRQNCRILCIDTDKKALLGLKEKNWKNRVKTRQIDANRFLSINRKKFDAIVLHASLHEISDSKNRQKYLENLFETLKKTVFDSGLVLIADYYYPKDIHRRPLEQYLKYQRRVLGHADAPEKFVHPAILKIAASRTGFRITQFLDTRAVRKINRRYYCAVLEKKN